MIANIKDWYRRYFSSVEAGGLMAVFLLGALLIYATKSLLAPMYIALVIAYLLQSAVKFLKKCRMPHSLSVAVVFTSFLGIFVLVLLILTPLMWNQLSMLLTETPAMLNKLNDFALMVPENYSSFIDRESLDSILDSVSSEVKNWGGSLVSISISTIPNLILFAVYAVLVPLIVFFLLIDSKLISDWVLSILPRNKAAFSQIWQEVDLQIGNYIRGKFLEALIIGGITFIGFAYFGMPYSFLLSLFVAISVLVPYVGAVIVTIPVVIIGLFHYGLTNEFTYVMIFYSVSQIFDGNILVPILFSNAVNLHPLVIILSVLFFGGVWGIWGVFFAIPLAVLLRAILHAWPGRQV